MTVSGGVVNVDFNKRQLKGQRQSGGGEAGWKKGDKVGGFRRENKNSIMPEM